MRRLTLSARVRPRYESSSNADRLWQTSEALSRMCWTSFCSLCTLSHRLHQRYNSTCVRACVSAKHPSMPWSCLFLFVILTLCCCCCHLGLSLTLAVCIACMQELWPAPEDGEIGRDKVLLSCVDPALFGDFLDEYRKVCVLSLFCPGPFTYPTHARSANTLLRLSRR